MNEIAENIYICIHINKFQDVFFLILCRSNQNHLYTSGLTNTFGQALCDVSPAKKRLGCLSFYMAAGLDISNHNFCAGVLST